MSTNNLPLVSVGMPVYNGEKGLVRALDSLLQQDYQNLEIIVSDNASTDATQEICNEYCRRDSRVKYSRLSENVGGARNFSRVFGLAQGEYFMWAAHDDDRHPRFVGACVEKLQERPDAVLCAAQTQVFIEGDGALSHIATLDGYSGITSLVPRYRHTLHYFPATAIYGVYRTSALRKTELLQTFLGADMAMIQALSLHGNFIQVPELLFSYYCRENWNTVHDDYRAVFGSAVKPWWYVPFIVLFVNNWRHVAKATLPFSDKLRLWTSLVSHEIKRISIKLAIRIIGKVCPNNAKPRWAWKIYWRWMHSPNVRVCMETAFLERSIKPRLGWW